MKSRMVGRVASVIIMGILLAWGVHFDHVRRGRMGREAFLAKEAQRFDKYFTRPRSLAVDLVGATFLAVPLFGLYEGLAWVLSKAFKGMDE